jgi:hypothetical protein
VHNRTTETSPAVAAPTNDQAQKPHPGALVGELLSRAAALCAGYGLDLDTFMRGAWAAYMDASPGLRERLEEVQLLGQLAELRDSGRIGEA